MAGVICNRNGISPTYIYQLRERALEARRVAVAGAPAAKK